MDHSRAILPRPAGGKTVGVRRLGDCTASTDVAGSLPLTRIRARRGFRPLPASRARRLAASSFLHRLTSSGTAAPLGGFSLVPTRGRCGACL
jgi:hypothetical protein